MAKLTTQYIEDHLVGVHTEESWAREIAEMALRAAITKLGTGSAEEVVIDAKFRVTAVEPEVMTKSGSTTKVKCVRVCVEGESGIATCKHFQIIM